MEKAKIYIGTASIRQPEWKYTISIHRAIAQAAQHGLTCMLVPHIGDSLISRARQDMLADYLSTKGFDYYLTVDDDINLPVNAIVDLYERQKDIVGGFYRLKDTEPIMAVRVLVEGERPIVSYFRDVIANQECIRVKYISTGCTMIKKDVFLTLQDKHPELKYFQNLTGREQYALYAPFVYKNEYLSEDWALCQRAIDAGYHVWVDGKVLCGHMGHAEFRIQGV